jgi:hypothetical protein
VRTVERQFVKTARSGSKVYYYLAERLRLDGKIVQRIIRPLSADEATLFGYRNQATYSALSSVLRLPIAQALSDHSHEHVVQVRILCAVGSPKSVIYPSRVSLEQAGRVPFVEFHLTIPKASRPVLSISVRSSYSRDELSLCNNGESAQKNGVKSGVNQENSAGNGTLGQSHQDTEAVTST